MATKNGIVGDIGFVVAGGLLGAGIALLFAPQSGKRTRQELLHLGKVARNKSEGMLLEVCHQADKLGDEVRAFVQAGKGYLDKITAA
jgi:gas vesicle protein